MTDNEKRIKELLEVYISGLNDYYLTLYPEKVAECLSNAGVIAPKFKVGQEAWFVMNKKIELARVKEQTYHDCADGKQGWLVLIDVLGMSFEYYDYELFHTKSEAEQALKGGVICDIKN